MSKWLNKLLTGFLILVVVIAAITAFRENLLLNSASYDAFVAVFDCFPFAKELAEIAAHVGQYGITMQGLSPSNILNDIAKIFAMAIVCPIFIGIVTSCFLKVPNYKDWYAREQYMSGIGYRIKECLISVIMMPICAYLTAYLLDIFQAWMQLKLPFLCAEFVSILIVVILFAVSTLMVALTRPMSMSFLLKHRLVVDLLGGILKILGMGFLCFLIALALLNDQDNVALGFVVLLLIYLAGLELIIGSIMRK